MAYKAIPLRLHNLVKECSDDTERWKSSNQWLASPSRLSLSLSLNGNADDDFRRKPPSEVTRINHFPSIAQMFETGESEVYDFPVTLCPLLA